ncbi:polysaccharide biosynthesis/export family protein [Sphingobacteriaceae bacterium WQ 2009]|uniref:Polysaccharide biosynthesis/export family protein n=1 Tax=Rhinopithecimicrobium faecis TaxID=2820698 RepID=A0A8T4H4U1_9SPHI|nr:polysaccharide biosynthesis/export family protein [Sphingobacteriaceae bacterium WQ 2009]
MFYINNRHYIGFFLAILLIATSCASRKDVVYFQPDETELNTVFENFRPKIQINDALVIIVSAADPKALQSFNQQAVNQQIANSTDNSFKPTYYVDEAGFIDYPILGKIKVTGLTRMELVDKMRELLNKYVVQPTVNITIANFKVTVVGEVAKPGTFSLTSDRITIMEALGMAGDLTLKAKRSNVLVVREIDGKKEMHRIDLTQEASLNSPVYYLVQNDMVYVEPNKTQVRNSGLGQNTNIIVSVAGLLITVISVLTR